MLEFGLNPPKTAVGRASEKPAPMPRYIAFTEGSAHAALVLDFRRPMRIKPPWMRTSFEVLVDRRITVINCVLSATGVVRFYSGESGSLVATTRIGGVGQSGLGDLECISAIQGVPYACGASRQVYRFVAGGQMSLVGASFECVSNDIVKPLPAAPEDPRSVEWREWLNWTDVRFRSVAGTSHSDVYAVGDECWHFDGTTWQQLTIPVERIFSKLGTQSSPMKGFKVLCTGDQCLISGFDGNLYVGTARSGFRVFKIPSQGAGIAGLIEHGSAIHVATFRHGIWAFDREAQEFSPNPIRVPPRSEPVDWIETKGEYVLVAGGKPRTYCHFESGALGGFGSPIA